ncbi:MAG: hypothetical protein R2932_46170 [Caldilineaceae bacterium]
MQHKIDLRIGPAVDTLLALTTVGSNHGAFDFRAIDADKGNYTTYYRRSV